MKRFGILVLVCIFMLSLSSAVLAAPTQIASAVIEEVMEETSVKVTVDLSDNWSVQFYPYAFYLYDQPFDPAEDGAGDYLAFGTLYSPEAYNSIFENLPKDKYEEKDGYILYTTVTGQKGYYTQVDENVYIGVIVDPAVDTDAVFARVSFAKYEFEK